MFSGLVLDGRAGYIKLDIKIFSKTTFLCSVIGTSLTIMTTGNCSYRKSSMFMHCAAVYKKYFHFLSNRLGNNSSSVLRFKIVFFS